jgi:hypothetical protein
MVLIIKVSPAQIPVVALLTLVPEVITDVGLTVTKDIDVEAENLKFGPSYIKPILAPAASSKII